MARTQLPPRECANPECSRQFIPTTQNRGQMYCSRSCKTQVVLGRRPRKPHTEATKRRISENRKGKAVGHPFWGNLDALADAGRKSAELHRKVRPTLRCARPGCENTFVRAERGKGYCSIACARKVDTKLGQISRGRTPAEGSGRCKWYDFYSSVNNATVRVQGSWELRVANCLDSQGLPWRTNHGRDRFRYTDSEGIERTFCPDFWQTGTYVEVKGYADPATQHKLRQVQAQGFC
jgi:CGNR zinc finger protein/NUMOD3 motif-containing protein